MARRPVPIKVSANDRDQIGQLLRGGVQQVRVVLRALALRLLAGGVTAPWVAQSVPLTPKAIRQIAHRYNQEGLDRALYEKQRPGAKPVLDHSQKQRIIAMVCSQPPQGRARWTVRLIAQDGNAALPELITVANARGVKVAGVDIQEPNLEAVFLHLTGRALRD